MIREGETPRSSAMFAAVCQVRQRHLSSSRVASRGWWFLFSTFQLSRIFWRIFTGGFFQRGFLVGLELDEHFAPALLDDFPHEIFIPVERVAVDRLAFESKSGSSPLSCWLCIHRFKALANSSRSTAPSTLR